MTSQTPDPDRCETWSEDDVYDAVYVLECIRDEDPGRAAEAATKRCEELGLLAAGQMTEKGKLFLLAYEACENIAQLEKSLLHQDLERQRQKIKNLERQLQSL